MFVIIFAALRLTGAVMNALFMFRLWARRMVVKSHSRVTLTGVESLKQSQDRQCHALIRINPQAARRHQRRDKLMSCLQRQPGVETTSLLLSPGLPRCLDAPSGCSSPFVTLGCASAVWQPLLTTGTPAPGSWGQDSAPSPPPRWAPAQISE